MNYLSFFSLEREPFSNALNSRFYYNSAQHARAVVRLMFAIENMKGLAVVTGPIGTGKSTTARRLLEGLPKERFEAALLSMVQSGVSPQWLLAKVAYQLGVPQPAEDRTRLLGQLYRRLYALHKEGRKAVILVDEAQMLDTAPLMEALRALMSLEIPEQKLLTLCLFGLPSLEPTLQLDPSLLQRVAVRGHLGALGEGDAEAYIKHRLKLAGASRMLFTKEAVQLLFEASGGVPRVINTLCDNALFEGFLTRTNPVTQQLVGLVADELGYGGSPASAPPPGPPPAPPRGPAAPPRAAASPGRTELDPAAFTGRGGAPRLHPSVAAPDAPPSQSPLRHRPPMGPGLRRAAALAEGGLFAEAGLSWPSRGHEGASPSAPEAPLPPDSPLPDPEPRPFEVPTAQARAAAPPLNVGAFDLDTPLEAGPAPDGALEALLRSDEEGAEDGPGADLSDDSEVPEPRLAPEAERSPPRRALGVRVSAGTPGGRLPDPRERPRAPAPRGADPAPPPEAGEGQDAEARPAAPPSEPSWIDTFDPSVVPAPEDTPEVDAEALEALFAEVDPSGAPPPRLGRLPRPVPEEGEAGGVSGAPGWRRRMEPEAAPEPQSRLRRFLGLGPRR